MRPTTYHAEDLRSLLRQQKIATMGDLKGALGTRADATVFRKLAGLDYRTSYSHRGRFYTLDEIARFDTFGLWSFRAVWFSRFGTLVATVEALAIAAEAGYDASELEDLLQVEAKGALLSLVRSGRLARQKVAGRYLYLAPEATLRRGQLAARSVYDAEGSGLHLGAGMRVVPDELKAAIVLFFSLLDERQRRLYAGNTPGPWPQEKAPPMTNPDITRAPCSPSAPPAPPALELPDLATSCATSHPEGCECPACLWQRLGAVERRDIRHAIDRRQAERRSGEERRQYSRPGGKDQGQS